MSTLDPAEPGPGKLLAGMGEQAPLVHYVTSAASSPASHTYGSDAGHVVAGQDFVVVTQT